MIDMIVTYCKSRNAVDIVLIDTYSTSNFWYAIVIGYLCRFFKTSYIPILHGGNLPFRLRKNAKTSRAFFGNAYINVVPSSYLYSAFAKANYKKILKIPNSINVSDYPFKLQSPLKPKLLWVRSFAEIYNPMLALHILEELLYTYPEATLSMVGPRKDGSLRACMMYAKSKKLPVIFTGKLSKEKWIKYSMDYDIFINTTNFDNTPVSVIEAMALGLPVVSTNVGGLPFLINDGVDGLLATPNTVLPFKNSIEFLIENPHKSELIVKNARVKAESYDWKTIKKLWNKLLS